MTKKFALMFALLLIPSFALAQDAAESVQVAAAVAQEENPPAPEPVAAADQAAPMVGQGCVNCGQSAVVASGCVGCGGTVVSTGCGCGAPAPVASCGCSTPAPSCGCNTSCCSQPRVRVITRRSRCCAPAPVASCGCSAPAPSCGCSAPAPVVTGCSSCASAPAPVSTGCGCGSTVVSAPVAYNVAPVSYIAPVSDCNSCNQTRTLRPFNGTLLRRR